MEKCLLPSPAGGVAPGSGRNDTHLLRGLGQVQRDTLATGQQRV